MRLTEIRVCIDVDDLERATAFYTAGLGFSIGRRFGGGSIELLGPGLAIDVLVKPAGTRASAAPPPSDGAARAPPEPAAASPGPAEAPDPLRDYRRHWTPVHLDLVVDDLETAVRRATAAGATLERGIQVERWGRMANLADPFGHGLCLVEFTGRGYDEIADPPRSP